MMEDYIIPAGYGQSEILEKHSRFIGHVWHVPDVDAALALIKDTRVKYSDATHNVFAYVIREGGLTRYSDDGEPGGSSGLPTMNVLLGAGVTDALCVVTRYFGGILLGRGGLARAYSKAAKAALDAAGLKEMTVYTRAAVTCAYPHFEQTRRLIDACEAVIENSDFGAAVVIEVFFKPDKLAQFTSALAELTSGTAVCDVLSDCVR